MSEGRGRVGVGVGREEKRWEEKGKGELVGRERRRKDVTIPGRRSEVNRATLQQRSHLHLPSTRRLPFRAVEGGEGEDKRERGEKGRPPASEKTHRDGRKQVLSLQMKKRRAQHD